MSQISEIQGQLRDTSAAIAEFERAVAQDPGSAPLSIMLKSFAKRKQQLEDEFRAVAVRIGTDVCRYRFFSDVIQPRVAPLCSALSEFQALYSCAYDSVKNGARKRIRKLPADVVEESSFLFGYTFSGSVGVVLTLDNNTRALFESSLDQAMASIIDLAKSRTSADVISKGKHLGVPVVRAMHKWASRHLESQFGADIEWQKGHETIATLLMQLPDLEGLLSAIGNANEIIEEEAEEVGRLVGADVTKRTFHLEVSGKDDITGQLSEQIPRTRTFEVGRQHKVTLKRRVKVFYSTDEEIDVSYQLLGAAALEE